LKPYLASADCFTEGLASLKRASNLLISSCSCRADANSAQRLAKTALRLTGAIRSLTLLDPLFDRFLVEAPVSTHFECRDTSLPEQAVNG
jgi:hypothetical protein